MGRGHAVLVTGGAGFIGSALTRRLVTGTDYEVVVVDKLTYAGNLDSLAPVADDPRFHFERVDICDAAALRRIFEDYSPTAVLHLAAESHVDRSIDGPADFIRTNIEGTFALLEAARRHWLRLPPTERAAFRFIHVSTDEVFGSLGAVGFFTDATPYRPSSPYAATKAGSDHLARAWLRTYGLPVIVTNCSNNFGPYQFPEKLIPLMILNGLEGAPLPVYGRGENVRDWLFVEDHVDALLAALTRGVPGETYLFGGGAERSNIEVVNDICRMLEEIAPDSSGRPRRHLVRFVEDRPGHDLRYAIDATSAQQRLGWKARYDFETGLRATVLWYVQNSAWWQKVRSGAYRGERLGLGSVAPSRPSKRDTD